MLVPRCRRELQELAARTADLAASRERDRAELEELRDVVGVLHDALERCAQGSLRNCRGCFGGFPVF